MGLCRCVLSCLTQSYEELPCPCAPDTGTLIVDDSLSIQQRRLDGVLGLDGLNRYEDQGRNGKERQQPLGHGRVPRSWRLCLTSQNSCDDIHYPEDHDCRCSPFHGDTVSPLMSDLLFSGNLPGGQSPWQTRAIDQPDFLVQAV
jgi:hypothetical protein